MLRRALTTLVLATVLVAACGEAASTPGTTSEPDPTSPPTTIAPDSSGLDDLAGAYTVPAAIEPRIFSGENPGYSSDLLMDQFTCNAIGAAISYELVACAEGGTAESPFIVVIGDEFVERDEATDSATVSLQYAIYRAVATPDRARVRAEVVMSAAERREVSMFEMVTLTLERVDTAAGRAIALHHTLIGGSRAQNTIEMIALNRYGSPQVVATYEGEGVAEFTDGKGFIYSGYHYADDEAMCCPSYVTAHYFRPGPNGWTHSRLTAPNDPDKQMDEESLFAGLRTMETVATYEYVSDMNN